MITRINQIESGKDKLLADLKGRPNIEGILTSYLEQVQETQETYEQMLDERSVYTAIGVQLDTVGALVGESRQYRTDEVYRAAILTRIVINNCDGTIPSIIQIIKLLYPEATSVKFWEHFPASINFLLLQTINDRQAYLLNGINNYWQISQDIVISLGEDVNFTTEFDNYDTTNHGVELLSSSDPLKETGIYIGRDGYFYVTDDTGTSSVGVDIRPLLVDGLNTISLTGDITTPTLMVLFVNGHKVAGGFTPLGTVYTGFNSTGGYNGVDVNRKASYEGYFRNVRITTTGGQYDTDFRFKVNQETSTIGSSVRNAYISSDYDEDNWQTVAPDSLNIPPSFLVKVVQEILPAGVRLNNIGYTANPFVFIPAENGTLTLNGFLAERPSPALFDLIEDRFENIETYDGFDIEIKDSSDVLSSFGRLAETIQEK